MELGRGQSTIQNKETLLKRGHVLGLLWAGWALGGDNPQVSLGNGKSVLMSHS